MDDLQDHIIREIRLADDREREGEFEKAYRHLERAHVLGQAMTREHTRVHLRMLALAWKMRDVREIFGQLIRIVGAATKTPFGIYPTGNTGGANVWFFERMPVPGDLQQLLDRAKIK